MARTLVTFPLAMRTPAMVLQAAAAFAESNGMTVQSAGPTYVRLSQGDELWTAVRVLEVEAQPTAEGVMVTCSAYLKTTMFEMDANPRTLFVGRAPRRKLWKVLDGLCRALGADLAPEAYRHG